MQNAEGHVDGLAALCRDAATVAGAVDSIPGTLHSALAAILELLLAEVIEEPAGCSRQVGAVFAARRSLRVKLAVANGSDQVLLSPAELGVFLGKSPRWVAEHWQRFPEPIQIDGCKWFHLKTWIGDMKRKTY